MTDKPKAYVIGYLCVFRQTPDDPWMPIGQLRNEIRESVTEQKQRLVNYLRYTADRRPDLIGTRRDVNTWSQRWDDIHNKKRTEVYGAADGKQYGVLRMICMAHDTANRFIDPHD